MPMCIGKGLLGVGNPFRISTNFAVPLKSTELLGTALTK